MTTASARTRCIKSMDAFCPLTPSYKRDLADAVRDHGQAGLVVHLLRAAPSPCQHVRRVSGHRGPPADGGADRQVPAGWLPVLPDQHLELGQADHQRSLHGLGSAKLDDLPRRRFVDLRGPDGTPLPTIRLENFRDGLEDYAYARLLEQAIKQVESFATARGASRLVGTGAPGAAKCRRTSQAA